MTKIFLLISSLIINLTVTAQLPSWTASIGTLGLDDIKFIKKSGGSTVLIATNNKIIGVSAKEKKVIWESKNFSNLTDSSLKVHTGTPYISITGTSGFGLRKEYTMLNAETGKVVFSNKTEDGTVTDQIFLNKKKAFLVFAKKGSGAYVSYRSIETGTEVWRKEFTAEQSKAGGLLGGLLKLTGEFMLRSEANNDNNDNVIVYTINNIFCLDAANGNTLWSREYKKPIALAIRSDDDKYLFVQYSGIYLNYLDVGSGKDILSSDLKLKNNLINVTKVAEGYMIITQRGLNILKEDGTYKYSKAIGKNIFSAFGYKLNDGYLLASNPDQTTTDPNTGTQVRFGRLDIVKVNEEGDKVWAKYLGGTGKMFALKSGLFVIDENMANLYNYTDGSSLWDGKLKLKGETSFGYDYDSLNLVAYNRGKIEMFNLVDGSYKNIITGFEFKDKMANNDQVFLNPIKEGVFINTNQNYALVGYDGKIIYNKSMVDASGVTKRFKNRLALVSSVVGLVGAVQQAKAEFAYQTGIYNGTITPAQVQQLKDLNRRGENIVKVGNTGAGVADFLNSFDKQSALSQQTLTILSNDGGGLLAVVIEKATGKEKKRVRINDTKPMLYVDDVTNTLYVITTLQDLKVYDLN
jgi:PQQ-like domain